MENRDEERQKRLMKSIRFSAEDLEKNREGILTGSQRSVLLGDITEAARMAKRIAVFSWIALVAFSILAMAVGLPEGQIPRSASGTSTRGNQIKWIFIGASAVCFAIAAFATLFAFISRNGERGVHGELPIKRISGTIEKLYDGDEFGATIRIGGREFVFGGPEDPVYVSFENGVFYTIYYVFNTADMIVSAETQGPNG